MIEFNCRRRPRNPAHPLRMQSDLVDLCLAACAGQLGSEGSRPMTPTAIGVVLAAGGYPGDYTSNHPISGLPVDEAAGEKVPCRHPPGRTHQPDPGWSRAVPPPRPHGAGKPSSGLCPSLVASSGTASSIALDIGWRAIEREQAE